MYLVDGVALLQQRSGEGLLYFLGDCAFNNLLGYGLGTNNYAVVVTDKEVAGIDGNVAAIDGQLNVCSPVFGHVAVAVGGTNENREILVSKVGYVSDCAVGYESCGAKVVHSSDESITEDAGLDVAAGADYEDVSRPNGFYGYVLRVQVSRFHGDGEHGVVFPAWQITESVGASCKDGAGLQREDAGHIDKPETAFIELPRNCGGAGLLCLLQKLNGKVLGGRPQE